MVCTKESRRLIQNNIEDSALRRENLQLRSKCKFTTIQMAVNFAKNGYRIKVLPGVYKEQRWIDTRPPGCEDVYDRTAAGATALTYEEHRQCPQRAEPDRDPGRHERRPHLRRQVQHPDRGHGRRPR